jgi:hypothetical protein
MREVISEPKVDHLSAPAAEHDVLELQVAVSHAHLGAAVEVLHARGHVNTPLSRTFAARLEDVKTRCVAGRELPITLF